MRYFSYLWRLVKELKNPSLFIYHLYHYANRSIPVFFAKYIRVKNCNQYQKDNIGDILIDTIDEGAQIVHPDMDMLNGYLAFVGTPYPYAMEEYENPCLYIGEDLDSLNMVFCPLDIQHERTQGVHLSDPCLASDGNRLYCIYRDTRYKDDYIYVKTVWFDDSNKLKLSDRSLLLEKKSEYALSPAVIFNKDTLLMYHVETNKIHSELILNTYDKELLKHKRQHKVFISNEPNGYYLWHIGISVSKVYKKIKQDNDSLEGLFLYVSVNEKHDLKLYYASSYDSIHWSIEREISMPDKLKDIIKFPYKSCFIPNSDKILLSFRDKKNRNRLIKIDINS